MRWLTNFYDFMFKWTATAGIGKLDCYSWWISKMQSGSEDTLKERYAIKLCFKLGKNATETYGMLQKQSEAFHTFLWHFFQTFLKQNFIAYCSSKVSSSPDCIFEIHQPWQSGFSKVYSNCCCRCSFKAEIIKIGQSSHKMHSNNIVNFQESTTIFKSLHYR